MSIAGKLVIAFAIALVASVAAALLTGDAAFDPVLAALFLAATLGTALATHRPLAQPAAPAPRQRASRGDGSRQKPKPSKKPAEATAPPADGPREQGNVKWFNAAKGFGFVTLDDGREIFVHFRSIRGEGRRSLRDGQRIEFVVADTAKGPQAEDVETLD